MDQGQGFIQRPADILKNAFGCLAIEGSKAVFYGIYERAWTRRHVL
jgi:hypothetical protein